jgi:hypothetical protein
MMESFAARYHEVRVAVCSVRAVCMPHRNLSGQSRSFQSPGHRLHSVGGDHHAQHRCAQPQYQRYGVRFARLVDSLTPPPTPTACTEDKRMKLDEWIKNCRGIDQGKVRVSIFATYSNFRRLPALSFVDVFLFSNRTYRVITSSSCTPT